jgi:hypothetical protein
VFAGLLISTIADAPDVVPMVVWAQTGVATVSITRAIHTRMAKRSGLKSQDYRRLPVSLFTFD